MGLLLGLLNYIPKASEEVKQGKWIRQPNNGVLLKGKTVGIIGYVGIQVALNLPKGCRAFGVKIFIYDKYKKGFGSQDIIESDMDHIFKEADVISLHFATYTRNQAPCK